MPRKRTTVAKRVTEEVTITEEIPWAPGDWDITPDHHWQQRQQQFRRTFDLLAAMADDGHARLDPGTLRQAVTMLRALPGASCMELEHGRSV